MFVFFFLSHYNVSDRKLNAPSCAPQLIDHMCTRSDVPISHPCKSSRTPQGSAKVSTATTACLCLKTGVAVYPFIHLSIDWAILTKAVYPIHQNSTAESRRLYKSYDLFLPPLLQEKGQSVERQGKPFRKNRFFKT